MSTASPLPDVIRDKLLAMERQRRELAMLSGIGEFLFLGSVALGSCFILDAIVNLPSAGRCSFLVTVAALLSITGWLRIARPCLRRRSWSELAAAVERDHPELKERLTTLVELRADADSRAIGSPLMHDLLARQTVKAVSQLEFTDALPARRSLQRGALGLSALAVLLFPFLFPGGHYALSWSRLLFPWGNHAWGQRIAFHVVDGDRVVAKGSDVPLRAEVVGLADSNSPFFEATLHVLDESGRKQRRAMTWNADEHACEITLPRVEQSFRYRFVSRHAVSREYRVLAADRPQITAWRIDVQPPAYTGLPARTFEAAVTELVVPEQSRVRFHWRFAQPVASAELAWPESVLEKTLDAPAPRRERVEVHSLALSSDRSEASAELVAAADGPFMIRLTSDLGLESDEPTHRLTILRDQPPVIELSRERIPVSVRPDDVLSIPTVARDDYGLTSVELHWETSTDRRGERALPSDNLSVARREHTWELDIADLKLTSGEAVTCRFRAVDNRPEPSPQETWSEPIVVAVSARAESPEGRDVAASQADLERELQAMKEALDEQQTAVDAVHRETAQNAVRGEQQPDIHDKLEDLRRRHEALHEQMERLREALQRRPLLEKIAAEHIPPLTQSLAAAERSLEHAANASQARDQIEELSQSLDELAKAEHELNQLGQESKALAALEQELAELARLSRRADKLADQASSLDREAAESSQEDLKRLGKETEDLNAQVDDLLRRRPELLEAARNEKLDRLASLADAADRLGQLQTRLAEALERGDNRSEAGDEDQGSRASPQERSAGPNNDSASREENPATADSESKSENASQQSSEERNRQITAAARRQQAVADEAARWRRERANAKGDSAPDDQSAPNESSPPEAHDPIDEFAQAAKAASEAAQAGDLQQAAEQSQAAQRAAQQAMEKAEASSVGQPQKPSAKQLSEEQSALAEEWNRLAKSPEARRQAQRQSQQELTQATQSLRKALEQTTKELSEQPLDLSKASQCCSGACRAAKSAGDSMKAASSALEGGKMEEAAQQARAAQEQLRQTAQQTREAAGERPPTSPQGRQVPGKAAGAVARAARALKQAQIELAQANSSTARSSAKNDAAALRGDSDESSPSRPSEQKDEVPTDSSTDEDASATSSDPIQDRAAAASPQQVESPSALDASAEHLRQAARALSLACQACRGRGGAPKPGSKPGQDGRPGSAAPVDMPIASEPISSDETPTGLMLLGRGAMIPAEDVELSNDPIRPSVEARNWGRLPKNLQTEILQGSAKKSHPEYAKQIKRYFEQIAQPAGQNDRP